LRSLSLSVPDSLVAACSAARSMVALSGSKDAPSLGCTPQTPNCSQHLTGARKVLIAVRNQWTPQPETPQPDLRSRRPVFG